MLREMWVALERYLDHRETERVVGKALAAAEHAQSHGVRVEMQVVCLVKLIGPLTTDQDSSNLHEAGNGCKELGGTLVDGCGDGKDGYPRFKFE